MGLQTPALPQKIGEMDNMGGMVLDGRGLHHTPESRLTALALHIAQSAAHFKSSAFAKLEHAALELLATANSEPEALTRRNEARAQECLALCIGKEVPRSAVLCESLCNLRAA